MAISRQPLFEANAIVDSRIDVRPTIGFIHVVISIDRTLIVHSHVVVKANSKIHKICDDWIVTKRDDGTGASPMGSATCRLIGPLSDQIVS